MADHESFDVESEAKPEKVKLKKKKKKRPNVKTDTKQEKETEAFPPPKAVNIGRKVWFPPQHKKVIII